MLRLLLRRPTTTIITTTCPIGSRADGMPSFFSRHLHGLLIWADRAGNKKHSPQCCKAIGHLQDVSKREIGPTTYKNRLRRLHFQRARAATGARDATTGARDLRTANSSRVALWRAKDKIKELASKLETFHSSKSVHGVLSASWILRVILTAPNVSGRGLAEAFHLVVGSDRGMVSRESVKNIRAAFLEMWKDMIFGSLRDFIAAQRRQPQAPLNLRTQMLCAFMFPMSKMRQSFVC